MNKFGYTGYFDDNTNAYGWIEKLPTMAAALDNAKINGLVAILPESNKRALIIQADNDDIYLQSYDTLILKITPDKKIVKLWNDYSKTTLKHIDTFLKFYGFNTIGSKKAWLNFKGETV